MNIGLSMQICRETTGLSQSEVARRTGIKQQNISRWEKNENIPNILDCITLAKFYGVSLDELILYDDTPAYIQPTPPTETVYTYYRSKDNKLAPTKQELTKEQQRKLAEAFDEEKED